MFYRSLIVFLFAVSSAIALLGQGAGDPVAYPTHPLPPIIVPWELGGPKYKLHTKDQDSAPFPAHRIVGNVYGKRLRVLSDHDTRRPHTDRQYV